VVTLKGAVLYDAGGYGMLGFGHTPDAVLAAMAAAGDGQHHDPSLSQQRFDRALRAEIGHRRGGGCPFAFMCLNSGSEAVGLAARIADINAKLQTEPGAPHAGARSSAWWSRAASMAVPTAGAFLRFQRKTTCSIWPATAARTR
jgi:4-aminobutyrate aminotransferase-like enzyme